jgi:site-specific recombinase XerD
MLLETALTEFSFAKDHSAQSRRWYASRLGAFAQWVTQQNVSNISDITPSLVRRYIEHRRVTPTAKGTPLSTHTLHGHVRAIKTLLNWAASDDLVDEKLTKRIALPKKEQKVIPVYTPEQIDRLLDACDRCDTHEFRIRNRALLCLLVDTGIRAAEACDLTIDRVRFEPDESYLLVNGKGKKQREVPLGRKTRQALHRYIHRARMQSGCPNVFLARGGAPLTTSGLDQVLYRLRDTAGSKYFQGVRVSAHTFRHTFAVRSLEAGVDLYKLSRLLGHSTVMTTENYLKAFTNRQARQGSISVLDNL